MSEEKDDISSSLLSAISAGNLTDVKTLVFSHSLSCCEGLYGGYALLRDTIESGHFEVAKFLLQQGINVAYRTDRVSTPLHLATRQNCVELMQLLLEKNAPVDSRNGQNETALHIAAKEGYIEIVKVLLSNNADVTAQAQDGSTPLLLAVEHGAGEVVRMLLQHACAKFKDQKDPATLVPPGKKSNVTVLNRVLLCNSSVYDRVNKLVVRTVKRDEGPREIVEDLIDHGLVVTREYVDEAFLLSAIEKNYEKLIKSILTITNPNDAKHRLLLLHSAIENNKKEIVELFGRLGYEHGVKSEDANSNGEDKLAKAIELLLAIGANIKEIPDLLHIFVVKEMAKVCKVLIEKGANINTQNSFGETPLHLCCLLWRPVPSFKQEHLQKMEKITRLLLSSGADVSIQDSFGSMAIHTAARSGGKEAVSVLLEFGADVDSRAVDGSTPLHLAHDEGTVGILCNNKAYVDARNKLGQTPLHYAAYRRKKEVVESLLRFGADIKVRGSNNETALHFLFTPEFEELEGWNAEIVNILLFHGCDANAKTNKGCTALDMAYSRAKWNFHDDSENEDLSDVDSDYEFNPETYLKNRSVNAVRRVKQHLIKLEVAALCEESQDKFDMTSDELYNFRGECEKEVERMKREHLNSEFSLYNVLLQSDTLTLTKVNSLRDALKVFDFQKYPIYESLVKGTFERRILRLDLMGAGCKSLDILVKTTSKLNGRKCIVLPIELLEVIVSYLGNGELRSLITCSDALKRQLSL